MLVSRYAYVRHTNTSRPSISSYHYLTVKLHLQFYTMQYDNRLPLTTLNG